MAKFRVLLVGSGGIGTVAALNPEPGSGADVTCVLRSNHAAVPQNVFVIEPCDHGTVTNWRPTQILDAAPRHLSPPFDYNHCCTKNIPDVSLRWTDGDRADPGRNQHRTNADDTIPEQPRALWAFPHPSTPVAEQEHVAREFIRIYSASGKTNYRYDAIVALNRWQKLVCNTCMYPICALTGLDSGTLQLDDRGMETLVKPTMREVIQVVATLGHHHLPENIIDTMIARNYVERRISLSMLVDLRKGNSIEHENLLGEVVREANAIELNMPTLTMLYNLCRAVQLRTKQPRGLASR